MLSYTQIAPVYDCTVGVPFFLRVRNAFEKLVRRYGIRFCSAAHIGCGTGLFACYLNLCWVCQFTPLTNRLRCFARRGLLSSLRRPKHRAPLMHPTTEGMHRTIAFTVRPGGIPHLGVDLVVTNQLQEK